MIQMRRHQRTVYYCCGTAADTVTASKTGETVIMDCYRTVIIKLFSPDADSARSQFYTRTEMVTSEVEAFLDHCLSL